MGSNIQIDFKMIEGDEIIMNEIEEESLILETKDLNKIKLFFIWDVPRSIYNIVLLGLIFMMLFTAFAPSQV